MIPVDHVLNSRPGGQIWPAKAFCTAKVQYLNLEKKVFLHVLIHYGAVPSTQSPIYNSPFKGSCFADVAPAVDCMEQH